MLIKGFKFGMILQLAIGPICIYVLNLAVSLGFIWAELAVLGTAFTDGIEIILAIIGVGLILEKSSTAKKILKVFGICILVIYGMSMVLSAVNISIIPSFDIPFVSGNTFITAILLALSNPLTIVFWAGVFSAKIIEENMKGSDLYYFALGCVLATLFFLSLIALVGSMFSAIIPSNVIKITNVIVGVFMLFFAYKNTKIKV